MNSYQIIEISEEIFEDAQGNTWVDTIEIPVGSASEDFVELHAYHQEDSLNDMYEQLHDIACIHGEIFGEEHVEELKETYWRLYEISNFN